MPLPETLDTGCRTDLLSVDDAGVGLRVTGRTADLLAGGTADVEVCDGPLDLAAGTHLVRSTTGSGLQVDRVVLRSGNEAPPVAAPPVTVRGDPQQLAYGLANLVRALTRDLGPPSRITVRFAPPAGFVLELPNGTQPLGGHLATLIDRPTDGSPAVPLGVAIANAVLERNGAEVALSDETPSTIAVRFTPADGDMVVAGNGTAPRSHR